jgi:putative acetyltransferase
VPYEIANYRPHDQEDLVGFLRALLEELGFDFNLDEKDEDLRHIPDVYQSNGGVFLLARHEAQIVGTVALRQLAQSSCELKRFYVRKDHRRRSLGTALLDTAIAHAKAGPWKNLRLDTSSKSPAAISLFRKHGFVDIARYNDDPFAEIFMELRLR